MIAEGEKVDTRRGRIDIDEILDDDLLWDGEAWVNHEGLIHGGQREVYDYRGVWLTPDQVVWTKTGKPVKFATAILDRMELSEARGPGCELSHRPRHISATFDLMPAMSEVYDICNAGPRHRFACSGTLVSN